MFNKSSDRNRYALSLRRKGARRPTKRPFKFPSPKKSRKTSPLKKNKEIGNKHEDEQKELPPNLVSLLSTSSTGIGTDIQTLNNNNNAAERSSNLKLTELRNEEEELINNQEELPLNPVPLPSASSSGIGKCVLTSNKNNKAAKRTPSIKLLEEEKLFNNQMKKKNGLLQHNLVVFKAKDDNRLSFKCDSCVHRAKKMRKNSHVEENCVSNDNFVSQTMTVNTGFDSDLITKIAVGREDNFELVLWARDEEINYDQVTDLDIALHYMNVIIENQKLKNGGKNEKCIQQFQKVVNNKFRGVISQHQRKIKPLTKQEKLVREWNDHVELLRQSDVENDRLKHQLVQINNKLKTAVERRRKHEMFNSYLCQWDNWNEKMKNV